MDILDEIIELLNEEKQRNDYVYISPEIIDEFNSAFFSQAYDSQISTPQKSILNKIENCSESKNLQKDLKKTLPQRQVNSVANIDFSNFDFEQLKNFTKACIMCPLNQRRTNVVFGEGSSNAELMFILEEPGIEEDKNSTPLHGEPKELLNKMIEAMGFTQDEIFITNAVKCHPINGVEPSAEEVETCKKHLNRQIELIRPKVIIIMGALPLKYLLNGTKISNERGKWREYKNIKVMPTFHPAFLLRQPSKKKEVWNDLKEVMKYLKTPHE